MVNINLVGPEGMCAFTDLTAVLQTGELTRAQKTHMAGSVGFEPTEPCSPIVFKTIAINQTRPTTHIGVNSRLCSDTMVATTPCTTTILYPPFGSSSW